MTRRIAVVSAGLGVPSSTRILADRLAGAAAAAVRAGGESAQVDVVELRPLARPLADAMLTGFPGPELEAAVETVRRADALVAVTPVFSASYSGLFKTFFDLLEPELLAGVPVLLGATAGTARHSLVIDHALRPLFAYLRAVPVPTGVFAASEDFGSTGEGALAARVDRAAGELAALLSADRGPVTPRRRTLEEELADPTPFAELLDRI
ncbi:CE1759 family FMN reductase [Nocardioides sp.]|uniref:CE1759 family FMN reductase n=1 Tax=Nocardioides sp. TaxID=35761 RepID=UPI00273690A9|nr:CE1759 family FMN reductase [Nocardioides sp.]MDP3891036.1 NAD(P)H-dependent oxidoreductase [Nocardioides sp.]